MKQKVIKNYIIRLLIVHLEKVCLEDLVYFELYLF